MIDRLRFLSMFEDCFARRLRKVLKISQKDMAKRYGVNPSMLSRYEKGETCKVSPLWLYLACVDKDKLNVIFDTIKGVITDVELQTIFEYWRKEFELFIKK